MIEAAAYIIHCYIWPACLVSMFYAYGYKHGRIDGWLAGHIEATESNSKINKQEPLE